MAEDYARLLDITGHVAPSSFLIRPLAVGAALPSAAALPPWAQVARRSAPTVHDGISLWVDDPTVRLFDNTAFPFGQNDGAVWEGRGLTTALDVGGAARWRGLTLTIRPQLIYTQNAPFHLPVAPDTVPRGYSPYAYPWHRAGGQLRIDMPLRFGNAAFWTLDPGQTSLTLQRGLVKIGVGTENLWWGPGRENAIVMSDNAAGFPHASFASSRPVSVGIGSVEWQWIWGRLTESKYFDTVSTNNHRFLTGLIGTFQPKPLPGLYLGLARLFYEYYPKGGLGVRDYLLPFEALTKLSLVTPSDSLGNDRRDQLLAISARWAMPASGFEAYVEWSRNDHATNVRDFLTEPEHSQGYTVGFQQAVPLSGGRLLRFSGELTHLEQDATKAVRGTPTYYTHHIVLQGFTQLGQVIGAGIGPGGDGQYLSGDILARWGSAGLWALRQAVDNDEFYVKFDSTNAFWNNQFILGVGARGSWDLPRVTIEGSVGWIKNYNRYWVYLDDVAQLHATATVRWHLGTR